MATQTLETLKQDLIFRISRLDEAHSVRQIEKIIDLVESNPYKKQSDLLKKLSTPIRKKLVLEELKLEQNWKPIDRKEFDRLVKELDIQEPLEQLLADI